MLGRRIALAFSSTRWRYCAARLARLKFFDRHLAGRNLMRFLETKFCDAWLIEPERVHDDRGYFARTFCNRELKQRGLETAFVQHSRSLSAKAGTLRGMHYQLPPHAEVKLVSCYSGAIWDVIVDLRPGVENIPRVASIRAVRRERAPTLHPGRLRARIPSAQQRCGRQLSYIVVLRAGGLDGHPLRRSSRWHRVASSRYGHLGTRLVVGAVG